MSDVVIGTTGVVPSPMPLTKPCYLVAFRDVEEHFIAIDVPKYETFYIEVKGVFTDPKASQDAILKDYPSMIDKNKVILCILFPWDRVHSVRGLPKLGK